nr:hypothetical protein [Tanacetum cinerariifolium]
GGDGGVNGVEWKVWGRRVKESGVEDRIDRGVSARRPVVSRLWWQRQRWWLMAVAVVLVVMVAAWLMLVVSADGSGGEEAATLVVLQVAVAAG